MDKKVEYLRSRRNYHELLLKNPKFVDLEYESEKYKERPKKHTPKKLTPQQRAMRISNIIKNFQDSERSSVTIKNLKPSDFNTIVNSVRVKQGFITTMSSGDQHITVTTDTILRLHDVLETIEINAIDSDRNFIAHAFQTNKITISQHRPKKYRTGGAFFEYLNPTDIDLTRYGIFKTINPEDYKLSCLLLALKNAKIDIKSVSMLCTDRRIPVRSLKDVSKIIKRKIVLIKPGEQIRCYGIGPEVRIGLINDHYFLVEKTKYTSYSIINYNDVRELPNWNTLIAKNKHSNLRFIDSFDAITLAMKYFTPIYLSTKNILKTQYYTNAEQTIHDLSYSETDVRKVYVKEKAKQYSGIYYADFETSTEDIHEAYMCCVVPNPKTYTGPDCAKKLLEYLPNNSLTYFHNLGYDMAFLMKDLQGHRIIKTGSHVKYIKGVYKKKTLHFKDSYAMISSKLSDFTKMFNLDCKKEIMPYALYNKNNTKLTTVSIAEALLHIKPEDKSEFLKLAEPYIIDNEFHLMRYAKFYCLQDCNLLMKGMTTFQTWIKQAFNLDVMEFLSLPSLAYRYLYNSGCLDNLYELSGVPQLFIQKCVKGGRCMTRDNKKYHLKKKLNDFDAVSLYPSAMARMGFLKGKPVILTSTQLNMEFLNTVDGYFIEITNVSTHKQLHFPLQSEITNGIRDYKNEFASNLYLDKFAVEDFIKYQGATFDIVRGYYYDSGRNNKIQEVIKNCFEQRKIKKAEGNKIETVYKLLMNASYGKMIQKPIKTNLRLTNSLAEHKKFFNHNHNYIKECTEISKGKYVYKVQKSVNRHFNLAQVGTEILSMSKRIMNEVMCLAEDLNLDIYYQDTDSMHIDDSHIKILAENFEKTYGRKLIGKDMGQFHNDFSGGNYATESIFLGKKAYIDLLDTGKYHIRMKGITNDAIKSKGNPMKLYTNLLRGTEVEFDLAASKPMFTHNKNFSIVTSKSFIRKVKF